MGKESAGVDGGKTKAGLTYHSINEHITCICRAFCLQTMFVEYMQIIEPRMFTAPLESRIKLKSIMHVHFSWDILNPRIILIFTV